MRISTWIDPPKMDIARPQPVVVAEPGVVWLSYRTHRGDHFAVVRFRGVQHVTFGDMGDEQLTHRPMGQSGLERCSFHEVTSSELEREELRRWVVTFPDQTLDLIGRVGEVLVRAIQAPDSAGALAMTRA